ncbi:MAG: bifunctional DNA primase/polymerase [Terracidiphilus sp.]
MESAFAYLQQRPFLVKSIDGTQSPDLKANPAKLPQAIRDAAKRGWKVFPILADSLFAVDALIGTATNDISILEHIPSSYPSCGYGLQTGSASGVCVAEMVGTHGASALYKLAGITGHDVGDIWDGLTLISCGGKRTYAYFKWPYKFSMMSFCNSEPNLLLRGECSWVPLPPSEIDGIQHAYVNAAAVEALPDLLIKRLFKPLDSKSGSVKPLKFPDQPTNYGSHPWQKRPDSFRKERKLLQFPDPVALRNKMSFPRRR